MDGKEYLAALDAMISTHEHSMEFHRSLLESLREARRLYLLNTGAVASITTGQHGGARTVRGGRKFLPYSNVLAEQVVAKIDEIGRDGIRSGDIARALGHANGYALKTVLQKLREHKRVRGELKDSGSYVMWFPAQQHESSSP